MNKENGRELKINKILIIMGVVCSILAIAIIVLPSLNKVKIETLVNSSKQMKNNYTTTTESNTWDISANGDGSVIATLDENGLLTIVGSGKMKHWGSSRVPWYSVRNQIKNVKIENGVKNIEFNAFDGCTSLTSIEISNSVTSIENCAFAGCISLTKIEIPSSVTSIGHQAFVGCTSLTNIEVDVNNEKYCDENGVLYTKDKKKIIKYPAGKIETTYTIINGVTRIGNEAFNGCTSLTSVEIPSSVTDIGSSAFAYCTNLISIEIPEGVTSIGGYAFYKCKSLTSIEIPSTVTDIESFAFCDCESLKGIEIPSSVTSIGDWAFYGCTSLTSIGIPSNVTSIGDDVFGGCISLTSIEVDENNEKYCDENGVLYTKDKKEIIRYPEGKMEMTYTIIKGVTSIGAEVFSGCTNLTSIELPESVTSIGENAFCACKSLTNIEIPEGVISIEANAFLYCTSLKSIKIPSSVTSIGYEAFGGCTSLTNIKIPENIISIGTRVFMNSRVTKFVQKTNNAIELPEFLKRVQNELDILYSCEEFTLTNCIIEDGKVKIFEGEAYGEIKINGGALDGLIYVITYTEWDISKNEDESMIATLDENGVLIVSGSGEMKEWSSNSSVPWYSVREQIKNIKIENGVISIDDVAFRYCRNLTSIEIPESVTSIGYNAFRGCTNLTNIEVNENNEKYSDENGVLYTKDKKEIMKYPEGKTEREYTIINGVTTIGNDAFYECTSLKSIEIPESVTSIGNYAFYECTSLTSIEIPESVTSIGSDSFYECTCLTSIKIPASVTSIGDWAFDYCTSLTIICKSGSTAETYAKENAIKYQTDDLGPEIESAPATNTNPSKKIEVKINVTDEVAGVNEQSIKYLWSEESQNITKDQITEECANEEIVELKDVTGTYYLWIYAKDNLGNETIDKKGPFILDNTPPIVEINYSTTNATNQNVTVTIKGNEELQGITGWTKSANGQELTKEYTSNTVVEGENITIKDLAGNESTVNVKILNIDKEQPSLEINTEITSTTIKLEVIASDTGSGINEQSYKYYIKEENGTYEEGIVDGSTHTFTDLKLGQKYAIKVDVTDNAGNKTNKEVQVITKKSNKLTTTTYRIDEEKLMIKEIQPKTTVGEIKNKIQGEMEFKIINAKGETVLDTAKVATGYKIKLEDNKEYTLVVTGDSNGDGETDIKDILVINKHRLNKAELVGAFLEAGDVNKDGKTDIKDILQINKFRLGKITEI